MVYATGDGRLTLKWIVVFILLYLSAVTHAQTIEYVHTDPLGSPVAITNEAGHVVERMLYEPYGTDIGQSNSDRPSYTGHVMDSQSGLNYMLQRYYDPEIGRFLSVDPVQANANTGASFNRFWYANNNPYLFVDPDGRQACGKQSNCYEAKNYDPSKAGTQTVTQSANIDSAAVSNLPKYESAGYIENAVRFDESASGIVVTTQIPTTTVVNGNVIESTISGIAGADAIGHSHPRGTSDPSPGPRDDMAVNAGLPNNIINNGNVTVVEKVNGQFRARILNDANLTPAHRREIQRDVNRFQKRGQ